MSTIKSSSENLTLNADGVGSDVVIKNNGTETVRVDGSGTVTATSLTVDTLTNQDTQLCKAWVNFDGTGTVAISNSYNVSSITDRGTGSYTVNLTVPFSSADFAAVGISRITVGGDVGLALSSSPTTTSSVKVGNATSTGAGRDTPNVHVACFGD